MGYTLKEMEASISRVNALKYKLCLDDKGDIYSPHSISFKKVIKTTFGFCPREEYEIEQIVIERFYETYQKISQFSTSSPSDNSIFWFEADRNRFLTCKKSLENFGFSIDKIVKNGK